jgi:hypothetical protein
MAGDETNFEWLSLPLHEQFPPFLSKAFAARLEITQELKHPWGSQGAVSKDAYACKFCSYLQAFPWSTLFCLFQPVTSRALMETVFPTAECFFQPTNYDLRARRAAHALRIPRIRRCALTTTLEYLRKEIISRYKHGYNFPTHRL